MKSTVQIGAMTRVARGETFQRALELIARSGMTHVGYLGSHEGRQAVPEEATDDEVRAIARLTADVGLQPSIIWGGSITTQRLPALRRRVEQAALLGVGWLLATGPYPYRAGLNGKPEAELRAEHDDFLQALPTVLDHARQAGPRVALKTHGGMHTGTGPGLAEVLRRVDDPSLDVFYDPGNVAYYEGIRPEADLPSIVHSVRGICVKDHLGPRQANVFPTPGDGAVIWQEIMGLLAGAGFAGPLLTEVIAADGPDEILAELRKTRERLEGWWASAAATG